VRVVGFVVGEVKGQKKRCVAYSRAPPMVAEVLVVGFVAGEVRKEGLKRWINEENVCVIAAGVSRKSYPQQQPDLSLRGWDPLVMS